MQNDSEVVNGKGIGDPTEYALIEMCQKIKSDDGKICRDGRIDEDIPKRKNAQNRRNPI